MKKGIKKALYSNRGIAKTIAAVKYAVQHEKAEPEMNHAIQLFVPEEKRNNPHYIKKLKRDMIFSNLYYGIDAREYFRYRFEERSHEARRTYVGGKEIVQVLKKLETPETFELFRDKYKTYQTFRPYYKREVIRVGAKDKELFDRFCENHDKAIVKPNHSTQGNGVHIVSLKTKEQCDAVFKELIAAGEGIVEEIIQQDPEQAKFHPQSVNTVRVITCYSHGVSKILLCTARFGTGESVIDNHCISAGVDIETGIITTPAREAQKGGMHLTHPDTGYQIIGTVLPKWNELIGLMKKLAQIVPEQRVVGWDMALSVDGWVIVEGNTRPAIQLLAGDGIGVRSILEDIAK